MKKKNKEKLQVVVPRNPLVLQMVARQGKGRHGKNEKANRHAGKVQMKKDWFDSSPYFLG